MQLLKDYLTQHKSKFIESVLLAFIGTCAGVLSYVYLTKIMVGILNGVVDKTYFFNLGLYILVLLIVKHILQGLSTSMSHRAAFETIYQMRVDLVDKLFKMPLGDIQNFKSGKLKNIIVEQTDSMEPTLAHIVPEATSSIGASILLFVYMLYLDWRLMLISLIPVVIGVIALSFVMNEEMQKRYEETVVLGQNMNDAVVEYIDGIEVIKTFNQSDKSYKKFSDAVIANAQVYCDWMDSCLYPWSIAKMIAPMGLLTLLPAGIYFYLQDTLDLASFMCVVAMSLSTVENLIHVMSFTDEIQRIGTTMAQIESVICSRELVHDANLKNLESSDIHFEYVDFSYTDDIQVLHNLSFDVDAGEVVGLVGESGSGKSTIIKLLAGFWDSDGGVIKIGDTPLDQIPITQLNDKISYVSQDNYLFDMSILENIRLGRQDATDEEVKQVAYAAGCKFIDDLEDGFDTVVGAGGAHVSGGQRQRICIARAMLKDVDIVVLDEATSYIDPENEAIMQRALSNLVVGKTLIVVAHRLRTIKDADKILVVDKGEIVARGTHEELLASSPKYKEMWLSAQRGE